MIRRFWLAFAAAALVLAMLGLLCIIFNAYLAALGGVVLL